MPLKNIWKNSVWKKTEVSEMYSRGKSINPEKQEKLDNMAKQFAAGGKKKWVRYDEGALLYPEHL